MSRARVSLAWLSSGRSEAPEEIQWRNWARLASAGLFGSLLSATMAGVGRQQSATLCIGQLLAVAFSSRHLDESLYGFLSVAFLLWPV